MTASTTLHAAGPAGAARAAGLLTASHPGPAAAVTLALTGYGLASGLPPERAALVAAAVLTGQLSIGWSNDLVDAARDRTVGRTDKPLATGALATSTVRRACLLAIVATLLLSLACGLLPGLVHLGCVAAGWAYNLGLKSTVLSWSPYAVAFGANPVAVALVAPTITLPTWHVAAAGALLGVGAHLVNVLPDLADDAMTGVRGLPHRLGRRSLSWSALTCLATATVLLVLDVVESAPATLLVIVLVVVAVLAVLMVAARGRTPFRAAVGIALLDVLLLVAAG